MTLKANELRIGNYLNGKQGHVIITEIRENNIVKIHDNTSSFYVGDCLKPIPLTEEWLLKFGFERTDQEDNSNDDWIWLFYQKDKIYIDGSDLTIETASGIVIKIEYVHQLQNLYFALTGEELILKNNSNN